MYILSGNSFKTKKALTEYVRQIISNLGCCKIGRKHEYYSLFSDLIAMHPERDEKIGVGVKRFNICKNPLTHMSNHVVITRVDKTDESLSWRYCCGTKYNNLDSAFRNAVWRSVNKFKMNSVLKCTICGTTSGEFHTDHNKVPFRDLVSSFKLTVNELPSKFDKNKKCLVKFRKEDSKFRKSWVKFHDEHCDLQILCKTCNLKKH